MPATKNKNKLILVTGATGRQGGAAARHLQERGFPVRALTRDPDQPQARSLFNRGAEVVRGNLEEPATLTRAMDGIHGIFAVQSRETGVEGEIRQGMNLADAAKRSRINHYVYSSVASADQNTGIPHFDSKFRIEEHVRRSGMHFTVVRPVFFMENLLAMRETIENGTLSLPLAPETRFQMVAVDDIGGVVAMAFEHPGKWQDRIFELAGDELSMTELAQALTRATGHDVRYQQIPWDQFEAKAGRETTVMFRWFQDTGYHVDIASARQEYPKLTSFDRWAHSAWHSATQTAG